MARCRLYAAPRRALASSRLRAWAGPGWVRVIWNKSLVLTLVEESGAPDTLPLSRRRTLLWMQALVIVDMLDDFVTGALANPHAERIAEPLAAVPAHAREHPGWVVVFSAELRVWGEHA